MAYGYSVATVFGGTGFIGRYIVRRLAKAGCIVRVASRHPSKANFLRTAGHVGQIVPMACNIHDDASVAAVLQGANLVVNMVGILHESRNSTFDTVQATASERIARIAAAEGATRLLHFSAIGADPSAKSDYARTKGLGEAAVRAAFPNATILRPSVVFGAEDQFFNRFAAMSELAPALPLIGGGTTRFQPVYVADVADAALGCLQDGATMGMTFELGGPRVYTLREVLEMVLTETRRNRMLLPLSWGFAETLAGLLGRLPNPPLTRDQVELLKRDNVVSPDMPGLPALGIQPTAVEMILPTYLDKYRIGGRFRSRLTA
ncbi:MAG TPA: complex I NDUFA9 subunit family protein [Azospirillaceae bacterium]|nr:complex I NDUFA9 subunit family protein [Azospirillaceae bacterium]